MLPVLRKTMDGMCRLSLISKEVQKDEFLSIFNELFRFLLPDLAQEESSGLVRKSVFPWIQVDIMGIELYEELFGKCLSYLDFPFLRQAIKMISDPDSVMVTFQKLPHEKRLELWKYYDQNDFVLPLKSLSPEFKILKISKTDNLFQAKFKYYVRNMISEWTFGKYFYGGRHSQVRFYLHYEKQ